MNAPVWFGVLSMVGLTVVGLVVLILVMAARATQGDARTSPYDGPDGPAAPVDSVPAALVAARDRVGRTSGLAWLALVVAVVPAVPVLALAARSAGGVAAWAAPLLVVLAFLAVHAVAEGTWPRPSGTARRAPLVARTVGQVAGSWPRRVLWGWAIGVVAVAAAGAALADRTGRGFVVEHATGTSRATPFPGLPYGVGALVVVVVVLLGTEVVLRQVAARPAVPDVSVADDLDLRRLSARRVVAGAQLSVAGVLAALLILAGSAMRTAALHWDGPDVTVARGWSAAGAVLVVAAFAVALTALVVAVVASVGRPSVRRRVPASAGPVPA